MEINLKGNIAGTSTLSKNNGVLTNSGNKINTQSYSEDSRDFVDSDCYSIAEAKAQRYLKELQLLVQKKEFLAILNKDFNRLFEIKGKSSLNRFSLSSLEKQQSELAELDSWSFLQKLSAEKQLKSYLDKSITYIFMRDLGKDINSQETQKNIKATVKKVHNWIHGQLDANQGQNKDSLSTHWMFRKAKALGVQETFYWLMGKLSKVASNLPSEIDGTNGMRKLVKIIAGVVMHQMIDLPEASSKRDKRLALERAIRLGYYYGLTYPLIDDLQDSANALSELEKEAFNKAIRESLLKGKVVSFPHFSKSNQKRMRFIYEELGEAFEFIRDARTPAQARFFFEQAFIFFEAQDIDRRRKLTDAVYSQEDILTPLILKSAGCRLIARDMLVANPDSTFDRNTFYFGIYNQFNDDIKDIFDDLDEGNVTPYTYYLTAKEGLNDATNPYLLYWAVVYFLIYRVYDNNPQCKRLLLERSINAHKSVFNQLGEQEYQNLERQLLNTNNSEFNQTISKIVNTPNDVAWFDKLVSRQVSQYFAQQSKNGEFFAEQYQQAKSKVEEFVELNPHAKLPDSQLLSAASYSLTAGGKRLRPVLAYLMMNEHYQLPVEATKPVIQLLEYMHTASLIFDDKSSQDDADYRRGKPTLHKEFKSEATAELAGVFLMMRAVEVQASIKLVDPSFVLQSIAYAASTTQAISEGQLLDLQSSQQTTQIKQLEKISELKTGLAIEAALIIPAILAGENDIQKGHFKRFARHMGLAFQIKDDLLDLEGDLDTIGKPTSQDSNLGKASFVTCLGESMAREKLFEHYFHASELLVHFGELKRFMQQLLEYVVHREK